MAVAGSVLCPSQSYRGARGKKKVVEVLATGLKAHGSPSPYVNPNHFCLTPPRSTSRSRRPPRDLTLAVPFSLPHRASPTSPSGAVIVNPSPTQPSGLLSSVSHDLVAATYDARFRRVTAAFTGAQHTPELPSRRSFLSSGQICSSRPRQLAPDPSPWLGFWLPPTAARSQAPWTRTTTTAPRHNTAAAAMDGMSPLLSSQDIQTCSHV